MAECKVALFAIYFLLYLNRPIEIELCRQFEAEPSQLYVAFVLGIIKFDFHINYCSNKNHAVQEIIAKPCFFMSETSHDY